MNKISLMLMVVMAIGLIIGGVMMGVKGLSDTQMCADKINNVVDKWEQCITSLTITTDNLEKCNAMIGQGSGT